MDQDQIKNAIRIATAQRQTADDALAEIPDYLMTLPMFHGAPMLSGLVVFVADYLLYWWSSEEYARRRYPAGPSDPTDTNIGHHYPKEVRAHWARGWNTLIDVLGEMEPTSLQEKVHRQGQSQTRAVIIDQTLAQVGFFVGQIVLLSNIRTDSEWFREAQ